MQLRKQMKNELEKEKETEIEVIETINTEVQ
jgi:hypothetical protein